VESHAAIVIKLILLPWNRARLWPRLTAADLQAKGVHHHARSGRAEPDDGPDMPLLGAMPCHAHRS